MRQRPAFAVARRAACDPAAGRLRSVVDGGGRREQGRWLGCRHEATDGALGFRKDVGTSREVVLHEETWTLASRGGGSHALDLHRRLNNSELLANRFSYEEFLAAKRPTPGLGPSADSAWRKLDYLFALAVPPVVYVRWKCRDASWTWLPWLYVRHSVDGVRKRL
jgi:hypothetical protein